MTVRILSLAAACALALPVIAQADPPKQDAKDKKVDFATQVWPILERSCIECHSTAHAGPDGKLKKPKGGVVLDSKDGISGSKKGTLVVAKKSADSKIYKAITLPADDEDRMPPAKKGDPLAKSDIDLIKAWIDEGAEFGKWTAGGKAAKDGDGKDTKDDKGKDTKPKGDASKGGEKGAEKAGDKPAKEPPKKDDPLVKLGKGLQPVAPATLAALAQGPFTVASVGGDSPLLRVGCAGFTDVVDDAALAALAPIASHVAELDLGRSHVGDEGCKAVAAMPRLVRLDLRQTQVGNHGVAALAACTELRTLNLFGTKTGDYGLAALAALKHLEDVYVWQTECSAAAVVRLRESLPTARVVFAADLPEPLADGAGAPRRRAR